MKQLFQFLIIFSIGAASFALLNPFLASLITKDEPLIEEKEASAVPTTTVTKIPTETTREAEATMPQVDQTGGVHDGPFSLFSSDGTKVAGSVQIIRSPEETLLQFENTTLQHSNGALIYFATDKKATKFFSLGEAKLTSDVLVYGMPIDANVGAYTHILIYNPTTKETEFYAKI